MEIKSSTALVTGANRGLGRAFAQHLVERGARTVYAAARRPEQIDLPGVVPLALDVTDPASVEAAAAAAQGVDLLVNNAGVTSMTDVLDGDGQGLRAELEVNLFGPLTMTRAFAPALAAAGGGAVVNVLSAMSWLPFRGANAYHVSKAAAWALTNGLRLELAEQGTLVTAVHLGMADTDMTSWSDGPKLAPAVVVEAALDGVEAGAGEVLVDDWSRGVKSRLPLAPEEFAAAMSRDLEAVSGR